MGMCVIQKVLLEVGAAPEEDEPLKYYKCQVYCSEADLKYKYWDIYLPNQEPEETPALSHLRQRF